MDFVGVANQNQVGYAVGQDLIGCFEGAFFRTFGQDDALLVGLSPRNKLFNEFHIRVIK